MFWFEGLMCAAFWMFVGLNYSPVSSIAGGNFEVLKALGLLCMNILNCYICSFIVRNFKSVFNVMAPPELDLSHPHLPLPWRAVEFWCKLYLFYLYVVYKTILHQYIHLCQSVSDLIYVRKKTPKYVTYLSKWFLFLIQYALSLPP